jgi:hypothetical protein
MGKACRGCAPAHTVFFESGKLVAIVKVHGGDVNENEIKCKN